MTENIYQRIVLFLLFQGISYKDFYMYNKRQVDMTRSGFLTNVFHVTNLTITTVKDPISQAQAWLFSLLDICSTDKEIQYKMVPRRRFNLEIGG